MSYYVSLFSKYSVLLHIIDDAQDLDDEFEWIVVAFRA